MPKPNRFHISEETLTDLTRDHVVTKSRYNAPEYFTTGLYVKQTVLSSLDAKDKMMTLRDESRNINSETLGN